MKKANKIQNEKIQHEHTSNNYRLVRLLSSRQEDDILLRSIDIVVLKEEDLVDTMILKSREFDKNTNGSCK